jgi:hypothetical protein
LASNGQGAKELSVGIRLLTYQLYLNPYFLAEFVCMC